MRSKGSSTVLVVCCWWKKQAEWRYRTRVKDRDPRALCGSGRALSPPAPQSPNLHNACTNSAYLTPLLWGLKDSVWRCRAVPNTKCWITKKTERSQDKITWLCSLKIRTVWPHLRVEGVTLSGTSHLFQVSFSRLKTIHLMTTTYERMLSRDQCLKEDYECSAGQAEFRAPFGP